MANQLRQEFRHYLFRRTLEEIRKRHPDKSRKERRELARLLVGTMWVDYHKLQSPNKDNSA